MNYITYRHPIIPVLDVCCDKLSRVLVTRRTLFLLALASLWIFFTGLVHSFFQIFWLHIIVVAFLVILDYSFSASRENIIISRNCEEKLSLLVENSVTLTLENVWDSTIRGRLVDDYPDPGRINPEYLDFNLPKGETITLNYRYRPEARGDIIFPRVYLRIYGRWGFVIKRITYPLETRVQVFPDLIQTRRYDLLAKKGALFAAGIKPIGRFGRGNEFSQLREYLPDDEFRAIDWKGSARKGSLVVREYQVERSQPLTLFIDCGRQMVGRIDEHTRLDYAINAALMLAYVAILKGDQVGLLAFSTKIQAFITPRRGASQLNRIIKALYAIQPSEVESDYAGAFRQFLASWRKRSLIVLFSDVVDPSASSVLLGHLPSLHPRHLPMAVLLKDPELVAIETMVPQTQSDLYEKAVACDLASSRELASRQLRQAGCLVIDTAPQKLSVEVVNEYLKLKARSLI